MPFNLLYNISLLISYNTPYRTNVFALSRKISLQSQFKNRIKLNICSAKSGIEVDTLMPSIEIGALVLIMNSQHPGSIFRHLICKYKQYLILQMSSTRIIREFLKCGLPSRQNNFIKQTHQLINERNLQIIQNF